MLEQDLIEAAKNAGGFAPMALLLGWFIKGQLSDIKNEVKGTKDTIDRLIRRVDRIETENNVRKELGEKR